MKAVIIGAGIGGLATANLLAKAGYEVEVYEQSGQPGGRIGQLIKDGFTFDTGPSWLLMRDVFEHYYQLFGTSLDQELDLIRLDPAYKVFYENKEPITITSDLRRDSQTFENIEQSAGAKLEKYIANSQKTYDLALKHFLYTNFSRPANFLHRDILRNSPQLLKLAVQPIHSHVAGYFRDRRLQQIMEYQMVFLGVSPYKAPAIYNLMSTLDFSEGVYYPRGGMYTLIESFVKIGKRLGVKYFYNAPAAKIITRGGKATAVRLQSGKLVTADVIISNADLEYTESKLLPTRARSYPSGYWLTKQPSPGALLVYLGVKGKLKQFEHHNLLFVDAWRQNFGDIAKGVMPDKASIYICKSTASDPSGAPKGQQNIFVLIPIPAGIKLRDPEQHVDHYLQQIKTMTGADLTKGGRTIYGPDYFGNTLHSWQASMLGPAHSLSQSAMFRPGVKSKRLSNLYYVGASARPGIGMPMCLISAELVYKSLINDRSPGPIKEIK